MAQLVAAPGSVDAVTPHVPVSAPRATFLDGLRGLAALFVVTFHTASAFVPAMTMGGTSPVHTPIDHFLRVAPVLGLPFKGTFSVNVFFVLSGIALSMAPLRRRDRAMVVSAAIRRTPRLMVPAFGAALIAAVLMVSDAFRNDAAATLARSAWFAGPWQTGPSVWGPLREATLGIVRADYRHVYVPVLWTMHYELIGSMLLFALFLVMPPRWLRFIGYAIAAILLWQSYLFGFVAGVVICEVWLARGDRNTALRRWIFIPLGLYGLLLGSCPSPTANGFYRAALPGVWHDDSTQAHSVGAALLLAAVVALPPAHRALSVRPLRLLGRVSFSLYLLHFMVLGSVGAQTFILLYPHLPYPLAVTLAAAVTIAASLTLAWIYTVAVDEPLMRRLSRVNGLIRRIQIASRMLLASVRDIPLPAGAGQHPDPKLRGHPYPGARTDQDLR